MLVLSGDVPLVSAELIAEIVATHEREGAAATVVTAVLDDPGSYGRVVRSADGAAVERIVEAKAEGDATAGRARDRRDQRRHLRLRRPGAWRRRCPSSPTTTRRASTTCPTCCRCSRAAGGRIVAHVSADPNVILGVNSRADLALVEAEARRQILERHMLAGVTIVDPASTWIEVDVEIAADVRIEPGCSLIGDSAIGTGSRRRARTRP